MSPNAIQPTQIGNVAHDATERCHRRMVKTHLRSNPPSRYRIGEKVHVRLAKKGRNKTSRKHQVVEALVEGGTHIKYRLFRHHLEDVNDDGLVLLISQALL